MKFVNLTPHALDIEGIGILEPSGQVARVETKRQPVVGVKGVRVIAQTLGKVQGLPDMEPGVSLIVSAMVLGAIKEQSPLRAGTDVFAPDTGPDAVRENGQVVKVLGLVC